MTEDQKKIGRPSKYTQEKANEICTLLSEGLTLQTICELPDMPSRKTVHEWTTEFPDFRDAYTHARQLQADALAERVVSEAFNSHDAQIGRLRMDALRWYASKLAPKKYGEKVEVEQTGNANFKISFSVPDRTTSGGLQELQAPAPQLLEIQPEPVIVPEPDPPGLPE